MADENWRQFASCIGAALSSYYPEGERVIYTHAAQRTCERCYVRFECLSEALTNDEQHGMWGGLSRNQRVALAVELGIPTTTGGSHPD